MKRILFLLFVFATAIAVQASTFTVTNTNDSGTGSLREAMTFCNLTPGADNVVFNIPGIAPHTIYPLTVLPVLNDPGTTIDGTTQPANGYTGNGRKIVLDGSQMSTGNGIEVNGSGFTLKGVKIQQFRYNGLVINAQASGYTLGGVGAGNTISENFYRGIAVNGAANGTIKGNFIGTNDDGTLAKPNEYEGISLYAGANGTTVGGTLAGEGNVISGNRYYGIQLQGVTNCSLLGNMIGVNASGTAAIPNEYYGVLITDLSSGNAIGSATPGGGNVISGNLYHGIAIECSSNNAIKGNKIGTDISGGIAIPNEYSGIDIGPTSSNFTCSASSNQIGGINAGEGNVIANNLYYGVNVWGASASFNPIRGNTIFCNAYDGISLHDGNYGQPDGNDGYLAPTITSANASGATGTAAANDFVDLYLDDQCTNCEPRTFVATVQANGTGSWTYSGSLSGSLTAIATHPTNHNSSANSPCTFISTSNLPLANFMALNTSFCGDGCTSFLDFSTGQPTAWSWSFPGGTPSSSTAQNPQNVCYGSAGTYNVSLTVTNGSGSDTHTMTGYITVNPAPLVSAGLDVAICEGDTAQLQGQSNGGYTWTPATGLSSTVISNPTASPAMTTSYVLSGTLGNCDASDTVLVTVHPTPQVTISQIGNTLTATAGSTFQWYLNGNPIPGAIGQSYTATVSGTYTVTVSDVNGCSATSLPLTVTIVGLADSRPELRMQLSPNPCRGTLVVSLGGLDAGTVRLQVKDAIGRTLKHADSEPVGGELRSVMQVDELPNGLYWVVVTQGEHRIVSALAVAR